MLLLLREINQEEGSLNKISIHEIIEFANLTAYFCTRTLNIADIKIVSNESSVQSNDQSRKSVL